MRAVLVVAALLALSSCKRTYEPYYALEAAQSLLISRDGDDAYVSDEMDELIAGLRSVPNNAREKEKADALVKTLLAEQQRVRTERLPPPEPPKTEDPLAALLRASAAESAREEQAAQATPPPVVPQVVDAGPPKAPFPGMDEAAFVSLFGGCFTPGPAAASSDGGAGTSQVVRDTPECRARFGAGTGRTTFLFGSNGLWATRTETVVDGGMRMVPRPDVPEEGRRYVPGMPTEMPAPTGGGSATP